MISQSFLPVQAAENDLPEELVQEAADCLTDAAPLPEENEDVSWADPSTADALSWEDEHKAVLCVRSV